MCPSQEDEGQSEVRRVPQLAHLTSHLRAILGQQLVFVALTMEEEEQRQRITARHDGQETVIKTLMVSRNILIESKF